jgi:acyl-coenzyme A thioesterase PaaI-like protein
VEPRTHLAIDRRLCGAPVELRGGGAVVALDTIPEMAADERGLVHGGFVFNAADHAAMLAVNDPHVVLASASLDFLRPVRVGERLTASAEVVRNEGHRRLVRCTVAGPAGEVLRADLVCVVLAEHVFDKQARAAQRAAAASAEKGGSEP